MIYGLTGTRKGLTAVQRDLLAAVLQHTDEMEALHHGDCVGADAECHGICVSLGVAVVLHPPLKSEHRAFCTGAVAAEAALDFVERDRRIVDSCRVLIATPNSAERLRSGTWATVRYARRSRKTILLLWPDGTMTIENSTPTVEELRERISGTSGR